MSVGVRHAPRGQHLHRGLPCSPRAAGKVLAAASSGPPAGYVGMLKEMGLCVLARLRGRVQVGPTGCGGGGQLLLLRWGNWETQLFLHAFSETGPRGRPGISLICSAPFACMRATHACFGAGANIKAAVLLRRRVATVAREPGSELQARLIAFVRCQTRRFAINIWLSDWDELRRVLAGATNPPLLFVASLCGGALAADRPGL